MLSQVLFLPSFLIFSPSYLAYKALFFVISFLVVWYICLGSFFVHCKNSSEYLTRATTQMFIFFMIFLLQNLVLRSFVRYSFIIRFQYSLVRVIFYPNDLIISWYGNSLPSIICIYPLLIINMTHCLSQIQFLYPDSIFLLFVLASILFHFLKTAWCHPSTLSD